MTATVWKQGDTGPAQFTLRGPAGPANLVGATVTVDIVARGGASVVNDAACDLDDAANGVVSYDRQAADTATAGTLRGLFKVVYSSGDVEHFPSDGDIVIVVEPDLD